mmetsp:Transcript_8626/g.26699  ORF Transcript_8626/g.26699 Transcript_8626/m.26699 type:complete len:115 (+) Transcript_8626:297-641(+)
MSRASCDTSTTPPLNSSSASESASIDCMSRWLVGSSNSRMCGCDSAMDAKTTRAFCPPESLVMGAVWLWLTRPNLPSILRIDSTLDMPSTLGYNRMRYSTGVSFIVSTSRKCCE